jgi:hypothetical protein
MVLAVRVDPVKDTATKKKMDNDHAQPHSSPSPPSPPLDLFFEYRRRRFAQFWGSISGLRVAFVLLTLFFVVMCLVGMLNLRVEQTFTSHSITAMDLHRRLVFSLPRGSPNTSYEDCVTVRDLPEESITDGMFCSQLEADELFLLARPTRRSWGRVSRGEVVAQLRWEVANGGPWWGRALRNFVSVTGPTVVILFLKSLIGVLREGGLTAFFRLNPKVVWLGLSSDSVEALSWPETWSARLLTRVLPMLYLVGLGTFSLSSIINESTVKDRLEVTSSSPLFLCSVLQSEPELPFFATRASWGMNLIFAAVVFSPAVFFLFKRRSIAPTKPSAFVPPPWFYPQPKPNEQPLLER